MEIDEKSTRGIRLSGIILYDENPVLIFFGAILIYAV